MARSSLSGNHHSPMASARPLEDVSKKDSKSEVQKIQQKVEIVSRRLPKRPFLVVFLVYFWVTVKK